MFKTARAIAQKYGRVAIEDLQVWNMTKSTRGTIETNLQQATPAGRNSLT